MLGRTRSVLAFTIASRRDDGASRLNGLTSYPASSLAYNGTVYNGTASNGTTSSVAASASKNLHSSSSDTDSTAIGEYIMHGLDGTSESRSATTSSSTPPSYSHLATVIVTTGLKVVTQNTTIHTTSSNSSAPVPSSTAVESSSNTTRFSLNTIQASSAVQVSIAPLANYTIVGNTEVQYLSCMTSLVSYMSASYAWAEGQISKGSYTLTTSTSWASGTNFTTIYPSSASTYKLCDGSPRADVKPMTTSSVWSSSFLISTTQALPATFLPAPCTLGAAGCAWLYTNTTIWNNTMEWGDYLDPVCGLQPDEGTACVFMGGPIRML